jgi:hypothetical protein
MPNITTTISDQAAAIDFCTDLMNTFVRNNTNEGITIEQSLYLFARLGNLTIAREWPDMPGDVKVDLSTLMQTGAIPTLYFVLLRLTPDDMTQPYHWLSQARIDWMKGKIEEFIGLGMAAYIQSLP